MHVNNFFNSIELSYCYLFILNFLSSGEVTAEATTKEAVVTIKKRRTYELFLGKVFIFCTKTTCLVPHGLFQF